MNIEELESLLPQLNRAELTSEQLIHILRGVQTIRNGSKKGRIVIHIGDNIESIQIIEDIQLIIKKFKSTDSRY